MFYYKNDVLSQKDAAASTRMWTTSAFDKMVLKLAVLRDLLLLRYTVLYIDSDVLLFKDPFPALHQYDGYDLAAQRDETLCAGFMYLRPTVRAYNMIVSSIQRMYTANIMDQDAINDYIHYYRHINYTLLPTDQFMSGARYGVDHQFSTDHAGEGRECE